MKVLNQTVLKLIGHKKLFIFTLFMFISIVNAQVIRMGKQEYRLENSKWYNYSTSIKGDQIIPERLIVKLVNKKKPTLKDFNKLNLSEIIIDPNRIFGDYYVVEIKKGIDPFDVAKKLHESKDFDYVEFDALGEYGVIPQDPQFQQQWNLNETKLQMELAWSISTGNKSIILAIIDSGTDYFHEDLNNNIWVNPGEDYDGDGTVGDYGLPQNGGDENGIDDDGNGFVDDLMGWNFLVNDNTVVGTLYHGTAVAGIAGAQTNNYENGAYRGISGIAGGWGNTPGVSMMLISTSFDIFEEQTNASGIAQGITYAAENGADVMNISMGVPGNYSFLQDAVDEAVDNNNCVIVVASMNDNSTIKYPAKYAKTIAVGATDANDVRYYYSNYGSELDVVAPSNVMTTYLNNIYINGFGGTSAASPHVAGLASLIRSIEPTLSWSEVRSIIRTTADKVSAMGSSNFTTKYGYGRINAYTALVYANANGHPPVSPRDFQIETHTDIYPYRPKLKWTANVDPDIAGYKVERKINNGSWIVPVNGNNISPNTTEFIDMEVLIWNNSNNQTAYYRMKAFDTENLYSDNTQTESINFYTIFKNSSLIGNENESSSIDYHLFSNYPNPFNPSTSIKYQIKDEGFVSLIIYDILGKKIVTLVNEYKNAGYYKVDFSANEFPSGVYIYKLSVNGFISVKKMLLSK